jgi:hypothetical protein
MWGTMVLTAAFGGFAFWLERRRDTDLQDPTAGITAAFKEASGVKAPPIRFRDVAQAMGIVARHGPGPRSRALPEDTGSGLAWGDIDGDGDWDLYLVNFPGPLGGPPDPDGANHLYRNDGGRFTDVTAASGTGDPGGFGMGASFADYDGDGDTDLYVTNYGPNRLFRNRGDGTFEQVAEAAGVADPSWSTGVAWGDYDRDGHLDLYVGSYVTYEHVEDTSGSAAGTAMGPYVVPFTLNPNSFDPQPNRLFRNRGDGTFEDVAAALGVANPDGRSLAVTFCDLDGDGWLDLYVNNDVSENKLYRNLGALARGTDEAPGFADISTLTGSADPRGSMGLSVADLGGVTAELDGLPDLFITHWVAQENALYQSVALPAGDFEYRDKTRHLRLGEVSIDKVGWGCAFADLDLDGRLDIAVANGSTLERKDDRSQLAAEPLFLLWNTGDGFHDVAPEAGEAAAASHSARGLAAADFDGDGDVDLAVAVNRGRPLLLRNETETRNRSLVVRLRGADAVRFGARVEVEGAGVTQRRWWGADVGYLGMHAPDLVFGLGETPRAARVRVRWADGSESALTEVPAGRVEVTPPGAREQRH